MKVFTSKRTRRIALLAVAGLVVVLAGAYLLVRTYAPFLFDAAAMREWIEQFGAFAPLVFILAQIAQVIVAPIPGQVTAIVGGYLFGPVAGTAYSMVGVTVGSAIAFLIAQRYGRPVVERMIDGSLLDRFDGFVQTLGVPGLFLFVVIPGLPDDVICFLAGLAHFRLLVFVGVMFAGRLPAYVVTNFAGDGLATGNVIEAVVLVAALVVFSLYAYRKREEIKQYTRGM
jgi:uncharacterized membrane protein YdjX (TVP38/TMEM64 family)